MLRARDAVRVIGRPLRNRWVQLLLNTALAAGMMALLLHSTPLGVIEANARPRALGPLPMLLGALLLSQLARALRWRWIVAPVTRVSLLDALWVNSATQLLNYLIPVRAGEGMRLLWLHRRRGAPAGTALGCLVVDHTFDLCGVIAVLAAGAGLRMSSADAQLPGAPTLLSALAGAVLILGLIGGAAILGPRISASARVPGSIRRRIGEHAANFRAGTSLVTRSRRLPAMVGVSAVAVCLDGIAFALLFSALGLAVPLISAVVAQVTLLYAYILPAAPGYVGSLEAGGTVLLTHGLGLQAGAAAGAMVTWHVLGALMVVVMGALAVHRLRRTGQLAFGLLRARSD